MADVHIPQTYTWVTWPGSKSGTVHIRAALTVHSPVPILVERPCVPPKTLRQLRRECFNVHWFESLHEAHACIEAWRREYNESRPYRALQDRTPEEFAKRVAENQLSEPLITAGDSP
jgi:transposase InsO family protein